MVALSISPNNSIEPFGSECAQVMRESSEKYDGHRRVLMSVSSKTTGAKDTTCSRLRRQPVCQVTSAESSHGDERHAIPVAAACFWSQLRPTVTESMVSVASDQL